MHYSYILSSKLKRMFLEILLTTKNDITLYSYKMVLYYYTKVMKKFVNIELTNLCFVIIIDCAMQH